MKWKPLSFVLQKSQLPDEYTFEPILKGEVPLVIDLIQKWYPDIQVGSESRHLRPEFYHHEVYFEEDGEDGLDKPVFAVTYKYQTEIVGFLSFEKHDDSRVIMGSLGVVSPQHRGQKLGAAPVPIIENMGRLIGAELILHIATLKTPHQQVLGEKHGFKLVGIIPAHDRDLISPGVSKRVFEALYVKVLVEDSELLFPPREALTPNTQRLFEFLFGDRFTNNHA